MKLAHRLVLGAVLIVSVLMVIAVALSGQRLRGQLRRLTTVELGREARLVAQGWSNGGSADEHADSAAAALGHRVTLVDSMGTVLGDSEFDGAALEALENHNGRPEIIDARRTGMGSSDRVSASEGRREIYVAVTTADGRIARVSIGTAELEAIVARARGDVLISGVFALTIALALAAIFSRVVSRPVTELRDVANALAAGDLSRRPSLSAPGEIGELGTSLHRMAEQLDHRMRALQAEDDFLAALIESLDEGVIAVDRQRQVVRINGSGRRLLSVSAETPFSVDLLPRDRALHQAINEAISGKVVNGAESRIRDRTLAVTARPLEVRGAVVTLFDLTELRRLETIRRDFVANVSHELKTPLTAIRGFAETLAQEIAGDHPHARFAETIRANSERMQRLVDDLLDLSRIESGSWVPTVQPVDLPAAVDEAIAPYAVEVERRGAAIRIDLEESAHSFNADPVAVRQIVGNLVSNAVRYTARGGQITIFARRENDGITLGVRDTGPGIPPEHLPRIFERFYRADAARSRAEGGTGLGLAIVRHLVEAHGGRARAESEPGKGTTVTAYFPESHHAA